MHSILIITQGEVEGLHFREAEEEDTIRTRMMRDVLITKVHAEEETTATRTPETTVQIMKKKKKSNVQVTKVPEDHEEITIVATIAREDEADKYILSQHHSQR
mmetsp:Transcript_7697/g.28362  ORF Transcript_7697/g.28362 Transcript_7697/m.28362 type:complete len:103 (+) Transcript_7697:1105-1413(+)